MNTIWLRGVGQFGDLQSAIFNIPVSGALSLPSHGQELITKTADIMTLTTTLTVFLCQLYFAHAAFRGAPSPVIHLLRLTTAQPSTATSTLALACLPSSYSPSPAAWA